MSKVFNGMPTHCSLKLTYRAKQHFATKSPKYLYAGRGLNARQTSSDRRGARSSSQHIAYFERAWHQQCSDGVSGMDPFGRYSRMKCQLSNIPVQDNGIVIERLPINMRSLVYVNPSNQFRQAPLWCTGMS